MSLHKHHIIPRHAGGTNDPSNIYPLTITQHALAHRNRAILCNDNKDWIAWLMLSGQIAPYEATIQAIKLTQTGRKHTAEHIAKIKATKIARGNKLKLTTEELHRRSIVGKDLAHFMLTPQAHANSAKSRRGIPKTAQETQLNRKAALRRPICSCIHCHRSIKINVISKHYTACIRGG